jgi:hypothetical protein
MVHRWKRGTRTKFQGAKKDAQKASFLHLDEQLDRILSNLADLLLRHGYGYQRISRLTKIAYVKAAHEIGKRERSRSSIARIAALTGLTRIEVSKILKSANNPETNAESELNRATRVAYGWVSDTRFLNDKREPKVLAFSGRHGFAQLVRKYSGDIPARAMLSEMKRLGMVTHAENDVVSLIRQRPVPARSTIDAIGAIVPWVDLLADAVESSEGTNLSSKTQQLRIYFESQSQVLSSIRELENRRRSFVSSIEQLGTNSRATGGLELTVSIAVAAAQPKRIGRRKRLGDKSSHEGQS